MHIARIPFTRVKCALVLTLAAVQIATVASSQTNADAPATIKANSDSCSFRTMRDWHSFAFNQTKGEGLCRSQPGDFVCDLLPLLADTNTVAQFLLTELLLNAAARQRLMPERRYAQDFSAQAFQLWPSLSHVPANNPASKNKNSPLLKWGGLGAFWWAAFFDHYQDAIQDAGNRDTYLFGANSRHWHFVKNLAHLGYLAAGFSAGVELGQERVSLKHFALRATGAVLIYWFIQNLIYDKALHNVWFDYDRKHTTDSIVIFDLTGKDHRIELSRWSRPALDIVRVALGAYLVAKY